MEDEGRTEGVTAELSSRKNDTNTGVLCGRSRLAGTQVPQHRVSLTKFGRPMQQEGSDVGAKPHTEGGARQTEGHDTPSNEDTLCLTPACDPILRRWRCHGNSHSHDK